VTTETAGTVRLAELGWDARWEALIAAEEDAGQVPARILREEKQLYLVCAAEGELLASVSGRFMNDALVPAEFPKVGDWVTATPRWNEGRGTIHRVLPRRNLLSRKEPWARTAEQVIATNLDYLFIMAGLDRDFNVRRLERYMVAAFESGIEAVIILNKADLCDRMSERKLEVEAAIPNTPVHTVSATDGLGVEELGPYLGPGRTVAFIGSSGVGKSTLINRLLGRERQVVRELREGVGKGRHTTTSRELISLAGGALVVDNPGMRELQVWLDADDLFPVFGDVEDVMRRCRFRNCTHTEEPGCAVKAKLESGELNRGRYEAYLKLKDETRRLAVKRAAKEHQIQKALFQKRLRKEKKKARADWRQL